MPAISFLKKNAWRNLLKKIVMALAFASLTFTALAGSDFQKDFERANQLYDLGKFSEAEGLYDTIVEAGHYSPEIFYNLGNAKFRLKKNGEAILNYERALALSPNDPEVRANLSYAREQTGAKIAPENWRSRIVADLDVNIYCWAAAGATWICIFALAIIFMRTRPDNRVPWFIAICFVLIAGYSVFAVYQLEQNSTLAIVTSKSIEARFAPADNSTLAATLPEGSRVWILERHGLWTYCVLPDNSRAWVSSDTIHRVRLHTS